VSLSRRRVVRQKRPTAHVTASPIPPSQRRDLGRVRLHSAALVILVSYLNSYKMSRVYLFDRCQTNNVLLYWHDRPRSLAARAVNLRSPKGAPKAQRLTANARAKRQSACHEAAPLRHVQQPSGCSNESLFHQSTCDGGSRRSCELPRLWRASCRASWR
jgi:hypothetical protein